MRLNEHIDGRDRGRNAALRRKSVELARVRTVLRAERARAGRQRGLLAGARTTQEQLRRITRRALAAQEDERLRISRELHDEIAQILTGIDVQLAILGQASTLSDRTLRRRIAHVQRFVKKSVTAVHRFARELRPALLDDLGLIPALRSLIRNLAAPATLRIRLAAAAEAEVLDSAKRTVLFRVAQEALANVVRHARATLVVVRLRRTSGGIELTVSDDGRSFDVERALNSRTRRRLGLLGMRERVDMVGGVFGIVSAPGKGTSIRASMALAPAPGGRER